MKTVQLALQFNVPGFLGDAAQEGRWRTPPFKAQLRQWWRVAYAARHNYRVDVARMRQEEGRLFGHAWLENDPEPKAKDGRTAARKSEVRLRLSSWQPGSLTPPQWGRVEAIRHPEVDRAPVAADLYLGYGPLQARSGLQKAAIQANEIAAFSLAYPEEHAADIERALSLMGAYGTVGGRSRNGWGSYQWQMSDGLSLPLETVRDWRECLTLDWPHAIGKDQMGALIWTTSVHSDWRQMMTTLAKVKIGLRSQFLFNSGRDAPEPESRHWIAYPVGTNHSVRPWGSNARLPNTLRFKVRQTSKGLQGLIFHMPHLPPASFKPDRPRIEQVWTRVHNLLDELSKPVGARSYSMIPEQKDRRTTLKPSLDTIQLTRLARSSA